MANSEWDPWNFGIAVDGGADTWQPENLLGFEVYGTDGRVGKVESARTEQDASRIVVDTRDWLPGGHVVLPAGTIERVDAASSHVHIGLTKEQIRNSPSPAQTESDDSDYRDRAGRFFGPLFGSNEITY